MFGQGHVFPKAHLCSQDTNMSKYGIVLKENYHMKNFYANNAQISAKLFTTCNIFLFKCILFYSLT